MTLRISPIVVALAALSSACILAVSLPETGGAHCRFAGVESACGKCLAERCAAPVDACCFEDACGGVVLDVEGCASGSPEACARAADPSDRGGAHVDLSTCLARDCSDACAIPAKIYTTRCERAYVTSIEACRCELGARANDTACTEVGHPRLRCCAGEGWPGAVAGCECLRLICVAAAGGCICQLTANDENDRPSECSGEVCCTDPKTGSCACGGAACRPGETRVGKCAMDAIGCGVGKRRVEACSVPK
ncbi:MAG: hypothetical protein JST00_01735 [Deltaproteobacteria bacterium]|nr:hypothetical protein [Deltaproteobacteria bacterium]